MDFAWISHGFSKLNCLTDASIRPNLPNDTEILHDARISPRWKETSSKPKLRLDNLENNFRSFTRKTLENEPQNVPLKSTTPCHHHSHLTELPNCFLSRFTLSQGRGYHHEVIIFHIPNTQRMVFLNSF